MNENDIKDLQDMLRYWLLEDERYPGEQLDKIKKFRKLVDR